MRWRTVAAATAACCTVPASAVALADAGPPSAVPRASVPAERGPTLSARPRAVRAGSTLRLRGAGFPARAGVVLLVADGDDPGAEPRRMGAARAGRDGTFRAPIDIAPDVEPGRYVAMACRHDCRVSATAAFRVLAPRAGEGARPR